MFGHTRVTYIVITSNDCDTCFNLQINDWKSVREKFMFDGL